MPIATGTSNKGTRHDLKSLPTAYVVIRRMTWGEKLHRKSFMSKVKLGQEATGNRAERRSKSVQAFSAELDMMNEAVTQYEFGVSIVEHNLEYVVGMEPDGETPIVAKIDFKDPDQLKMLDGRVGEEIDDLIQEMNDFEADEETGK
jgi:hypothetical protein